MGLFDFWKKKPTPTPPPPTVQEVKQEKKEPIQEAPKEQKEQNPKNVFISSMDDHIKKNKEQLLDYLENGNEKTEGYHINEFNELFNPYRDLINRILEEKGV
nr:hypothetical protein [Thermoflexibacter sp.]